MAYMNQQKKAVIAAKLKTIMPKDWKYSLRVRNHSSIILTLRSAPVDVAGMHGVSNGIGGLNVYRYEENATRHGVPDDIKRVVINALAALNTDNHDRSDIMTDYFDVGHYVDFLFGEWNKPFLVKWVSP